MKASVLVIFLLLTMSFTLLSFISFAFRARRTDPAFSKGLYISMILVFVALAIYIVQILNGAY